MSLTHVHISTRCLLILQRMEFEGSEAFEASNPCRTYGGALRYVGVDNCKLG